MRTHVLDVEKVKLAILRFVRDNNVDSAALVEAMAEICGMTASALDREIGHQGFDERMAAFTERAQAAYLRHSTALVPAG